MHIAPGLLLALHLRTEITKPALLTSSSCKKARVKELFSFKGFGFGFQAFGIRGVQSSDLTAHAS